MVRDSWLLMTVRLTSSSLAGTERTLVAVGTPREASMLATIRPAAPRRGVAGSSEDALVPGVPPPVPAPVCVGASFGWAGAGAGATAVAVTEGTCPVGAPVTGL